MLDQATHNKLMTKTQSSRWKKYLYNYNQFDIKL